jgi:UV DNA damage endonuclease
MQLGWAQRNPETWCQKWREVLSHNLELLTEILEWNLSKGILLYRISSEIVPFADHPTFGKSWRSAVLSEKSWWGKGAADLRSTVREYVTRGGRLTMHPPQYVSLGSARIQTVRSSLASLEYHAKFLDSIGAPQGTKSPVNIHVSNGSKGEQVVSRVRESMSRLSPSALSRLVFENEQSGFWTVRNLSKFFSEIPITLDYHHHRLNPSDRWSLKKVEQVVAKSWGGETPVCHWSEGKASPMDPAHSELVSTLPKTVFDVEVEAKGKELAILPFLSPPPIYGVSYQSDSDIHPKIPRDRRQHS